MNQDAGLLEDNHFMTLATVCEDGRPWNVPITFAFLDGALYWRSVDSAVHSQNIARDSRVSISIFDAQPRPNVKGLQAFYLQSRARKLEQTEQEKILQLLGEKFSIKDEGTPVYRVPIGELDEAKSSDSRFYREYTAEGRKAA